MRKPIFAVFALIAVFSMLLAACQPAAPAAAEEPAAAAEQPAEAAAPTEAPAATEAPAEEPAAAGDRVQVRWFVGLGTGQQPEQVAAQEAVVKQFNESQDEIELVIEIVNYDVANDTLATEIAAGNAPDIIGPVGVAGSNAYSGQWLDMDPLVESMNYDLSDFDQSAVDFYRVEGEGLIGLPFAVYPYFMYYYKPAFDEAGLAYPPHEWGAKYEDGDDWDMDKLSELAQLLTVDANGNDATEEGFDPDNIVQFGYYTQWTDPRGLATMFGASNFVDEDGNAMVSDNWREAFNWYYDAIWNKHFYPTDSYINSDLLAAGNAFGSGNVAMVGLHLWCHACSESEDWDIAAMPSYNGEITAKLHADTFRIMKSTKNPEAAFKVLDYLTGEAAEELLLVYGGMPARHSLQDSYFATLDEAHPQGVDWEVAKAALNYTDNPSHEANMPNFNKATERIGAFQTLFQSTPDLDINAEIDKLVADLQVIFDEAE
ncbi:MAG: extracellular solute-binding protein [Chloroflexi bacterium]|nr:extracellular solute-binding protein [Chloroflexota bacterium]